MIRVGVVGALGKMGSTVCAAVQGAPDLELVAAVDARGVAEGDPAPFGVKVDGEIAALSRSHAAVAVDFTAADAAVDNLVWCAEHGIHGVCGTTGIDEEGKERLSEAFAPADRPNAILAPNFSVSAVVLMRLSEIAAPLFDAVEIIELHHNRKLDAPSGTSIETARRIADARAAALASPFAPDPTTTVALAGARGGAGAGRIPIHAVRLPGLVAHQEVIFGGEGQTLTIRQDTYERSSFMPGVLLAIRKVADTPGFTVGLDELLNL
jgi:4-hydroxy-tetrahydrodipicolinate reductase